MQTKECTRCVKRKPATAFARAKQNKDGLKSHCRDCVGRYNRARYLYGEKRKPPRPRRNQRDDMKDALYAWQAGECAGCEEPLPRRLLQIDRIIPGDSGPGYVDGNVQLLCSYCNSVKKNRSQEWFLNHLRELGVIRS